MIKCKAISATTGQPCKSQVKAFGLCAGHAHLSEEATAAAQAQVVEMLARALIEKDEKIREAGRKLDFLEGETAIELHRRLKFEDDALEAEARLADILAALEWAQPIAKAREILLADPCPPENTARAQALTDTAKEIRLGADRSRPSKEAQRSRPGLVSMKGIE